jgi:poly-gamma-glutamate capsule biosynthesis protein CapA/YwtB (metallophosphatase superfamily)
MARRNLTPMALCVPDIDRVTNARYNTLGALTVGLVSRRGNRQMKTNSAEDPLSLLFTGDAILNRPLRMQDPGFEAVREILASGDASFTNLEEVHPKVPFTPSLVYQGHNSSAPPEMVGELLGLGFNLFSIANNHTADFGGKGIQDTLDLFEGTDAAVAGAGDTLEAARRPRYLETAKGRVALIAATASNAWLSAAADRTSNDVGRYGVNPMRTQTTYFLDQERFDAQEEILRALKTPGATALPHEDRGLHLFLDRNLHFSDRPQGSLLFDSALIQRGESPEVREVVLPVDGEAIRRWIREARRQSDLVVVSIHCHQGANGGWDTVDPPQFLTEAAHSFIDAGADVIAGHGPHRLRPIEIYKGRPIFYSLGSFSFIYDSFDRYGQEIYEFYGLDSHTATPADITELRERRQTDSLSSERSFAGGDVEDSSSVFESVIAECDFRDGGFGSIRLHPTSLGWERPKLKRGYPALATISEGTRILNELAEWGAPFGTKIEIEETDGRVVGTIKIADG